MKYSPLILESADPDTVKLGGFPVDEIEVLSEVIVPDKSWGASNPTSLYHTIRDLEDLIHRSAKRRSPKCDPESIMDPKGSDILWRTLIANREYPHYSFSTPAPKYFATAYEVLRTRARKMFATAAGPRRR